MHIAITILQRKELKLSYIFILPFISACVAYYSNDYQVISVKMGTVFTEITDRKEIGMTFLLGVKTFDSLILR